jgi:Nuclease-related domain
VPKGSQRWTEVTPSQFTHEAEGLNLIRELLLPRDPFRAWSNFEFRDNHGRWHEVDLLVIGQRRIHLVELKYYSGTLRGDDHTWLRDGHSAEDSPLKLARRKAQRLATKLQDGLTEWAQENGTQIPDLRTAIPYIQESVFLHHPDLRCQLPPTSRLDLFGLDGREQQTGLPGISTRLHEPPAPSQSVSPGRAEIVAKVMQRIGVRRRQREAGSWIIDEDPLGEGDDWQDWPAFHKVATTNRARIRFLVTPPGAPAARRTGHRRIAEHEYRVMSRLAMRTCSGRSTSSRMTSASAWSTRATNGISAWTSGSLVSRTASRSKISSTSSARWPMPFSTPTPIGSCTAACRRTQSGYGSRNQAARSARSWGTGRRPARSRSAA